MLSPLKTLRVFLSTELSNNQYTRRHICVLVKLSGTVLEKGGLFTLFFLCFQRFDYWHDYCFIEKSSYLGGSRHYREIDLWKDVTEEQWNNILIFASMPAAVTVRQLVSKCIFWIAFASFIVLPVMIKMLD